MLRAQIPIGEISVDTKVFPNEKVQLSINSDVLLAGELLQYKAFLQNEFGQKSELSKIVYVSLRSENDSIIFNHKLNVENSAGGSDYFIPSSLKTGVYRLICYSNFSKNQTEDTYFQKEIYVLNTFLESKNGEVRKDTIQFKYSANNPEYSSTAKKSDKIFVSTTKPSYGFREKVVLNFENTLATAAGNYVLSVRKVNPLEISGNFEKPSVYINSSEIFYIPEIRGEIISGTIISNIEKKPMPGKMVSLTISGSDNIFKSVKTDDHGKFYFSIDKNFNSEKSFIKISEAEKEAGNYSIVLDDKDFKIGNSERSSIKIDTLLKDWLVERSVQIQIENAYFITKKDDIIEEKANKQFYNDLGKVYKLDDYTRFPTVLETFVEVIELAAIRKDGDDRKFLVFNKYGPKNQANFNDVPPLVLFNGFQIMNSEDLLNYNPKNIESIRVIIEPYRYGPKIYSGIIAVETKKNDYQPSNQNSFFKELYLTSAQDDNNYYQPDYENRTLSRIPDYRVQLLWNPDINLNEQLYTTTFFTSDVPGFYEISLEGFSNTGEHISAKNYFTVSGQ
jgi:hypothetical protein